MQSVQLLIHRLNKIRELRRQLDDVYQGGKLDAYHLLVGDLSEKETKLLIELGKVKLHEELTK